MAKPKRKKKATRNQKGLNKIQKTVEQLREEYESKYPFAVDYDAVETPEGSPSFEEFVLSKEANRAYNEADPLWKYQQTTQLGPLALQRWRNAKTSKDGKNYRVPYYVPPSIVSTGDGPTTGTKFGSGITADGKLTLGPEGLTGGFSKYKQGHREYMEQRGMLDKVKGIPGSILPPANYVTGRGASIGGRYLPGLAGMVPFALMGKKVLEADQANQNTIPLMAPLGLSFSGGMLNSQSQLVVPTAGLKLNPFSKESRSLKKQSRKDQKKLDKKLESGVDAYNRELDKEKANFERQAALYEKKYGVKPFIPEMTAGFKASGYQPGTGGKTQNRNPIFLEDGGKVKKGNTINGVQYDPYGFPVTDTTGTASYEKMAEYLLGTRGGTRERMEDLMYDIASTESGATYDPAIKQIGGGPGRGIFQYEGPGGSNRAKDALTRAVAYYNSSKTEKMPEWLSSYIKESNGVYDFSKLTIPQQKALFLTDYSQAKNIPFGDYMKGDISTEDMWAKYHKVSGADRPHFREMKAVGDRKKDARTMTSEKFREIVTGKSFMP